MKIKFGPGANEIELYGRDGEMLVGRDENGKWVDKITLTDITLRLSPQLFPIVDLEVALFGYEGELDVLEENVVATLRRNGITRIEGRKAKDADIHPDA